MGEGHKVYTCHALITSLQADRTSPVNLHGLGIRIVQLISETPVLRARTILGPINSDSELALV